MEVLKYMTLLLTVSVYVVHGGEAVRTAEAEAKPEVLKPIPLARELSISPVEESAVAADPPHLTPVNRNKRTLLLGKALAFGKGVLVGKALGGFGGYGGYGGHYYGGGYGGGYGGHGHGGYYRPSYGHCCGGGGGYHRPSYGGWGGSGSYSQSQSSSYGGGWGGGSYSSSSSSAGSYGWGK